MKRTKNDPLNIRARAARQRKEIARQLIALDLRSYMRDTCTGRALPHSYVRTCAMHVQALLCLLAVLAHASDVQATLCLSAVFVHARCMYRPRSAFQLCSHMRGMRGRRSARRMQSVCCTRMASPLAHENAHMAAETQKRARGSGADRLLPWLARSVPCCLHASIPQLATPNCGRSQTRVDLGM